MKNTVIASVVIATFLGGYAAVDALDAAAPDVRAVVEAARSSVASALPAHCEVPCGIYDDHAEIEGMRLDAMTMRKASAQITALSGKVDAASLNTITRWAMVKEEHGRKLQHTVAWYFVAQRVKAPAGVDIAAREGYHRQLAAFHRITVAAMKAAQNLGPAATDELLAAIDAVAPWYPAKQADAGLLEDRHLATEDVWRTSPGG